MSSMCNFLYYISRDKWLCGGKIIYWMGLMSPILASHSFLHYDDFIGPLGVGRPSSLWFLVLRSVFYAFGIVTCLWYIFGVVTHPLMWWCVTCTSKISKWSLNDVRTSSLDRSHRLHAKWVVTWPPLDQNLALGWVGHDDVFIPREVGHIMILLIFMDKKAEKRTSWGHAWRTSIFNLSSYWGPPFRILCHGNSPWGKLTAFGIWFDTICYIFKHFGCLKSALPRGDVQLWAFSLARDDSFELYECWYFHCHFQNNFMSIVWWILAILRVLVIDFWVKLQIWMCKTKSDLLLAKIAKILIGDIGMGYCQCYSKILTFNK